MTRIVVVLAFIVAIAWFNEVASAASLAVLGLDGSWGSSALLSVAFKCGMVDGKLVCGKTKNGSDNEKNNVKKDDDDDDDDRGKGKKGKGGAAELTECTIQQPGGGGGCKTGFKRVCEKMKSGKKCCGCVPDKNAKPVEAQQPAVKKTCCTSSHSNGGSTTYCLPSEAEARQSAGNARFNGQAPENITCAPEK